MKIQHSEDYAKLRRAEYPSMGDQLDALFKLAEHLSQTGVDLPPEVQSWLDSCRAVKAKYKKPAESST